MSDFPWRHYIATHSKAAELVGPGIVEFTGAFIEGTRDPNRDGRQRFDFVVRHADGSYWRLHPGSKPKNDADPKYFPRGDAAELLAQHQWQTLPRGGVFSLADAHSVPQTDRIGKKRAWQLLGGLHEGPLNTDPSSTFKWWLWLANLGNETGRVLGDGVVAASLTQSTPHLKTLTVDRVDGTTITVRLIRHRKGDIEVVVGV